VFILKLYKTINCQSLLSLSYYLKFCSKLYNKKILNKTECSKANSLLNILNPTENYLPGNFRDFLQLTSRKLK
jgi:hypothetical protein